MKAVGTEERYRLLAENASDIVCLVGIDGTLEWISPSVTRVLGWDPDALMGTQPWELVHPDDRAEALTALLQAETIGRDLPDATLRFLTPGGDYRWLAAKAAHATPQSMVVSFRLVDAQVRAQQALAASEERYRALVENASDVIMRQSPTRIVEYVSPSVERILGWRPDELVGRPSHTFWHVDDTSEATRIRLAVAAGGTARIRGRGLCKDGSYRWLEVSGEPLLNAAGDVIASVSMIRDVDAQVRAEAALVAAEERYRLLAENTMDLVLRADTRGVLEWVSPSVSGLLGYQPEDLVGRFAGDLIHPDDQPRFRQASAAVNRGEPATYRARMVAADGDSRWMEITPRPVADDAGHVVGRVVAVRDVDAEVMARAEIDHGLAFDGLTGLANRALALSRIQEVLDAPHRGDWALLCVGVDGMTAVNQAYTHAAGDLVLTAVAHRLVEVAGAHDRVARIAGDEFAVLMRGVVSSIDAARAAELLLTAVRGPVSIGEVAVPVSACVGIAVADGGDAGVLLRDATAAMRQAAASGSDRWQFLAGDVEERTRRALAVQSALRDALDEDRLQAWVMPLVRLSDGVRVGDEALVRLVRPDGTVWGPADFLVVAEKTGLILAIDRLMVARSLDVLASRTDDTHVAVNVSAAMLASGELLPWVTGGLARTGVDPRRLHLEVTETALLDVSDDVRTTMRALAQLGVSWWVDDFGTGYSSISHLRDLPIAGLKLDQSFTAGITRAETQATRLSEGLLALAAGLGLETIAEGVETEEQAEVLAAQGWQVGQGWLFGPPAPSEAERA